MTTDGPDELHITVRGRPVLTTGQAAARYGMGESAMRGLLTRMRDAGVRAAEQVKLADGSDPIGPRTPLFWADELQAAMDARPGQGGPGKRRRRTASAPSGTLDA